MAISKAQSIRIKHLQQLVSNSGSNPQLQRQQLDALVMGLPWQRLADGGVITVV